MRDCLHQRVGKFDHFAGVARLDEMLPIEIAVAKMKAKLDAAGDCRTQTLQASYNFFI
jgi:hypothetical protein